MFGFESSSIVYKSHTPQYSQQNDAYGIIQKKTGAGG